LDNYGECASILEEKGGFMLHTLYQVDAFTDLPFKGNPAGVCLLGAQEPDAWMQALAAEMNLSETAFLLPGESGWQLRWFTPKTEVDLCGHATLASAKVLFESQPDLRDRPLTFETRSGTLQARWANGRVELDLPAMVYQPMTVPHVVVEVLGFTPIGAVFSGNYYLFETMDAQLVREAKPNLAELAKLPYPEVMITARTPDEDYDFISRFFAPQLGVDEDPVTGSAHCLLSPYWADKMGKMDFKAFQASDRGGLLYLRLAGDRVRIAGDAVIVFKGELWI